MDRDKDVKRMCATYGSGEGIKLLQCACYFLLFVDWNNFVLLCPHVHCPGRLGTLAVVDGHIRTGMKQVEESVMFCREDTLLTWLHFHSFISLLPV